MFTVDVSEFCSVCENYATVCNASEVGVVSIVGFGRSMDLAPEWLKGLGYLSDGDQRSVQRLGGTQC